MNRVSIGSNNGLSPVRCQAITWTNAGVLSIGLIGTNFNEIRILILSFKKMHLKMWSAKMAAILSRGGWVKDRFQPHVWYERKCKYIFPKTFSMEPVEKKYPSVVFWHNKVMIKARWLLTKFQLCADIYFLWDRSLVPAVWSSQAFAENSRISQAFLQLHWVRKTCQPTSPSQRPTLKKKEKKNCQLCR